MIVSLNPCLDADEYVLPGSRPLSREELKLIGNAKAVLLPQGCSRELYAACFAAGPALFPEYGPRFSFPGKIGQKLLFERHSLPHPRTLIWPCPGQFLDALKENPHIHHRPFIVKRNLSHEGHGVFLIDDDPALAKAMDAVSTNALHDKEAFVTQDFIPPGEAVLRVVVLGSRTVTYWKLPASKKNKIITISRNAVIERDWRPGLQAAGACLCKVLARCTGINLAAVDVIFPLEDPGPAPLLLEINYFFGRRGLGGSENYYPLLLEAARQWLSTLGCDPRRVKLI
jgi:ribosomal protein S6--L-glutamate ligase